ncbi:MAG: efflux transporter periplasmic adaptor subunit [Burkholderiales bacterium]|nr:efflux transporter periplasmic adaptor subunit [Burkholderiales bacterium]
MKKIIFGLIAGLLVAIFIINSYKTKHTAPVTDNAILLSNADVAIVKLGAVDNAIAFTGDLSPLNQSVISSEVDAVVKQVMVQEGQFVNRGQVLAVLDDTDLRQAVSQQQAVLSSAKARFELDKNKLEKQKGLFDQGFISKLAYDELQTNYHASQELINQQQASLERAKKLLSDTKIRAPFTGYIYQKNIDNGQLAAKNGKLFSIASLDKLQIKAAIPSDYISQVRVGQMVSFGVETRTASFSGKISRINPVAELGTRSYYIYVDFDNKEAKLKAGQFIKGSITLARISNTPLITRDAIRGVGDNSYVLVLVNNVVVKKPAKILLTNKLTNMAAVSGVNVGDVVLLAAVLTIKPGDRAKIVN